MTFRLYVYLVLMDNLLFSCDAFRDKTKVVDTWRNYLRNYSTQIARTNWGFYAPKVKKFDWFEFLMHLFPLLGLKDVVLCRSETRLRIFCKVHVRVAPSTTKANRAANRPRRTTKPNPQVFGPDWQS